MGTLRRGKEATVHLWPDVSSETHYDRGRRWPEAGDHLRALVARLAHEHAAGRLCLVMHVTQEEGETYARAHGYTP